MYLGELFSSEYLCKYRKRNNNNFISRLPYMYEKNVRPNKESCNKIVSKRIMLLASCEVPVSSFHVKTKKLQHILQNVIGFVFVVDFQIFGLGPLFD